MMASFNQRWNRLQKERAGVKPHISWMSKLELRKYAERADVYVPQIYQVEEDIHELQNPGIDFVLKPAKGSNTNGVFPIVRQKDKFVSKFGATYNDWLSLIQEAKKSNRVYGPWFLEEYIHSPYEWKCYCFDGEVAMVRQTTGVTPTSKKPNKFWDDSWMDIGLIESRRAYDPSLPKPNNPDAIVHVAAEISRIIPWVFARIDLYEDDEKVVFSEITMHPGDLYIDDASWDLKLDKAWSRAIHRRNSTIPT